MRYRCRRSVAPFLTYRADVPVVEPPNGRTAETRGEQTERLIPRLRLVATARYSARYLPIKLLRHLRRRGSTASRERRFAIEDIPTPRRTVPRRGIPGAGLSFFIISCARSEDAILFFERRSKLRRRRCQRSKFRPRRRERSPSFFEAATHDCAIIHLPRTAEAFQAIPGPAVAVFRWTPDEPGRWL